MKIEPSLMRAAGRAATESVQHKDVQLSRTGGAQSVTGSERSGDAAVLSERALDVRAAQRAYGQVPEVRAERVEAVKTQIAEGTYEVDAQQIADKLLKDVL